jgi:hypothetical protein
MLVKNESLVLDLLEWLATRPRTHRDVMTVWRTSCPRLSIWEDAVEAGLVSQENARVALSRRGAAYLAERRAR